MLADVSGLLSAVAFSESSADVSELLSTGFSVVVSAIRGGASAGVSELLSTASAVVSAIRGGASAGVSELLGDVSSELLAGDSLLLADVSSEPLLDFSGLPAPPCAWEIWGHAFTAFVA
eukprot:1690084-Rhodomonas_salina.1